MSLGSLQQQSRARVWWPQFLAHPGGGWGGVGGWPFPGRAWECKLFALRHQVRREGKAPARVTVNPGIQKHWSPPPPARSAAPPKHGAVYLPVPAGRLINRSVDRRLTEQARWTFPAPDAVRVLLESAENTPDNYDYWRERIKGGGRGLGIGVKKK